MSEQYRAFLLKYGEIGVKGKNRHVFEETLVKRVQAVLRNVDGSFIVTRPQGRVFVEAEGSFDYDSALEALQRVFGVTAICPCVILDELDFESIKKSVIRYVGEAYEDRNFSFKVKCRRADKRYPMDSMEIAAALGEALLDAYPELSVDVHHPQEMIYVEIRERVNIYSHEIKGPGGMPVGTAGSAMLLLSGGIDSPVAGYMIAKRGVTIDAVYFHAPPYTSERAKQKVIDLAKRVSDFSGPMRLHIVNFTDIQLYIVDQCPHDEITIIIRRYMMRIAEMFAEKDGSLGLITGESIGQVASQTMQSLACTDDVCAYPVYRPLIGFDKQEIVDVAVKIGTYETSILPYEDCCTIFVAKHPVTKPRVEVIRRSEEKIDSEKMGAMIAKAVAETETIQL